jgi:CRP/FNR family transcriptional regulator, cyclic AMP receptor protein
VDTTSLLRSVDLFRGFTDEDIIALAPALSRRTLESGQLLFAQGDTGRTMYVVESGRIEIFLRSDALVTIPLREAGAGDFFGELSLFDEKPRSAGARALDDSVLLELPHTAFESFLGQRPHAASALLRTLSGHLRETNALLSTRAAMNVDAEFEKNLSWSDRVADIVAELNGSWKFIILVVLITVLWCIFNSAMFMTSPPDPYPYQFFNLALAILVGLQGPLIVMSQNRQSRKDRARADTDYRVNLKNEVNIESLLNEMQQLRADVRRLRGQDE